MSGSIEDFRNRFRNIIDGNASSTPPFPGIAAIEQFVFDDMSSMDNDRNKPYPVFLLKPPIKEPDTNDSDYMIYQVDHFTFDLMEDGDTVRDWAVNWARIEALGKQVIDAIHNSYPQGAWIVMEKNPRVTYGHDMMNDRLYGVRQQYRMRVYVGPC